MSKPDATPIALIFIMNEFVSVTCVSVVPTKETHNKEVVSMPSL